MIINPGKEVGHQEGEVQCSESLGGILRYYHGRGSRTEARRPQAATVGAASAHYCRWKGMFLGNEDTRSSRQVAIRLKSAAAFRCNPGQRRPLNVVRVF